MIESGDFPGFFLHLIIVLCIMFAEKYLKKNRRTELIQAEPLHNLEMVVVIPCFYEPDIIATLHSLAKCQPPKADVEVIILINHSETSDDEIKLFNKNTTQEIENWIIKNNHEKIRFYAVGPIEFSKKWAGAGVARKAGMDEAVFRFNHLENDNGIIVSLDADTLVERNYLVEIENYFSKHLKFVGATIAFEHQNFGLKQKHLEGIQLYEKYMKYFKNALEFTGYPYAMFTVGSAFAVRAGAYVKRGGMNRRQAGEDFYFLQNLAQQGKVGEIQTTKVFPSARLSGRVPFGTGPILQKWMKGEEDLNKTYNFQAFIDLKQFFSIKEEFFNMNKNDFDALINELPKPIQQFVKSDNFWNELDDLNQNCSSIKTFNIRFYQKFNAFKIIKFLNFAHEKFYEKANLDEQFLMLTNLMA